MAERGPRNEFGLAFRTRRGQRLRRSRAGAGGRWRVPEFLCRALDNVGHVSQRKGTPYAKRVVYLSPIEISVCRLRCGIRPQPRGKFYCLGCIFDLWHFSVRENEARSG